MARVPEVALDASVFIDYQRGEPERCKAARSVFALAEAARIKLHVSAKTVFELHCGKDCALRLAETLNKLPNYPTGCIADQVGFIKDLNGTLNDAKRAEKMRQVLVDVTNGGPDIRDQQAYLDAVLGGCEVFLTSDTKHFLRLARVLADEFGTRVESPSEFLKAFESASG